MTAKTNRIMKNLAYAFVFAAATATVHAADVSGDWTWTTPGHNGGPEHTTTLTLKADGASLTGKVATPGREGKINETPIAEGKVNGDSISFIVIRQNKGVSVTNNYSGTIADGQLTGKIETTHDGTPQSHDWSAKRATETK
ncbi:MAG TPA: hypothetical protein VG347_23985 [Verrucomicrobiae bacterium]|nr:hypothetical protein [Verrucomicrobiae bacterium]